MTVKDSIDGAIRRLDQPSCLRLFTEFRDSNGRPLTETLEAWAKSPADALAGLYFVEGDGSPRCRDETTAAFTVLLPDQVRILDCRLTAAVANAATRSATLNDLLQRVQRTDGWIYITPLPPTGPATRLLGGLSHDVSVAGSHRVLRIFVSGTIDDSAMAIMGHELRHALEVLELSSATTEAEVDALFDRLGWRTSAHTVETQAAFDAGNTIARELRASRPAHR